MVCLCLTGALAASNVLYVETKMYLAGTVVPHKVY